MRFFILSVFWMQSDKVIELLISAFSDLSANNGDRSQSPILSGFTDVNKTCIHVLICIVVHNIRAV